MPSEAARAPAIPVGRQGMSRGLFGVMLAAPMLIWQVLLFVAPLCFLVMMTFWSVRNYKLAPDFTFANWQKVLSTGYFWDIYLRTLLYALLAAGITSLVSFPGAFYLSYRIPAGLRRSFLFLLITPYFTSYLVRIYSWKILLTDQGLINLGLGALGLGPFRMYSNLFGTTVGYVTLCFPLVLLIQMISLSNVDRNLIEAAHNLGCGRLRTVFEVIIPSAKVGLVLAATFAFILSFGDFVSPTLLGGSKPPTLSILMVDTVRSGSDWPRASVIAMVMVATLLACGLGALRLAYGGRKAGR
ncbi:ABC transporter permease [Labrys monachus]|uniref:ABC-type spermidine/putrescine transport system permease subunit I n=1 Tax=Labrys monachus TaxID=217067 RepID=A0ABU0FBV3_9HYPH|nr:ABC transporter permease [Labrys monachus]MDQ0391619.1 ABC-type spermidine/putrescine transport system permease subunit I [Labrys monachus]